MPSNRGMVIQTLIQEDLVTKRSHNKILGRINRELGERHQRRRVKRHFARNRFTVPGGPYGVERRSRQWQKRKRSAGVDPRTPNVFTGKMKRGILSSSQVTATRNRWRWKARNPEFPMPEWQRDEIEAIAADEIEEDTQLMERRYRELANKPEFRRRRRRKV